jgi:hypothetical protein
MDKAHSIFVNTREYAKSDGSLYDITRRFSLQPMSDEISSETVPALQLADFAAYEILHYNRKRRIDPGLIRRKSFDALINAEPINGMFVDEKSMEAIHRLREGGWPFNETGRKAIRALETREQLERAGILTFG